MLTVTNLSTLNHAPSIIPHSPDDNSNHNSEEENKGKATAAQSAGWQSGEQLVG